MKILISPSKTIDFNSPVSNNFHSIPSYAKEAIELTTVLKKLSTDDLSKLMNISENLSKLNYERYQEFSNEFNQNNSVTAISGKNKFKFDIKEQGFAWIADNKIELKMIKQMRKGSRIMITGYNQQGSQTIDHYSLLGFTKAYNASRKACS